MSNKAFTLVELSIAIIIIGLIVGGVLGGQSLIASSRINSTVSQLNSYKLAHNAFKLEFGGIPGDLRDAIDYGLHADGAGVLNSCISRGTPHALRYNGNGNGTLDVGASSNLGFSAEVANYFIHLSNAGMLDQSINYGSNASCSGHYRVAGVDYPSAEVGVGINVLTSRSHLHFLLGNGFRGRNIHNATEGHNSNVAQNDLTTIESKKIDKKVDDGLPGSGLVKVVVAYSPVVAANANYGEFVYDTEDDAANCIHNSAYNVSLAGGACTLAIQFD